MHILSYLGHMITSGQHRVSYIYDAIDHLSPVTSGTEQRLFCDLFWSFSYINIQFCSNTTSLYSIPLLEDKYWIGTDGFDQKSGLA